MILSTSPPYARVAAMTSIVLKVLKVLKVLNVLKVVKVLKALKVLKVLTANRLLKNCVKNVASKNHSRQTNGLRRMCDIVTS